MADKDSSWFEKKHFIEDVGLLMEQSGQPRMAGRIVGWLLICDPPHQAPSEMAEVLAASKASISTMTRLLVQTGLIERVAMPGHRRDYYRLKEGAWSEVMRQQMEEIIAGRQLADRGLELMQGKSPDLKQRLKQVRDFYVFFEQEYPVLLERWDKERKRAAR